MNRITFKEARAGAVQCTAIKPYDIDNPAGVTDADVKMIAKFAARHLRCDLVSGHGGAHCTDRLGAALWWMDEPVVYFTTVP